MLQFIKRGRQCERSSASLNQANRLIADEFKKKIRHNNLNVIHAPAVGQRSIALIEQLIQTLKMRMVWMDSSKKLASISDRCVKAKKNVFKKR